MTEREIGIAIGFAVAIGSSLLGSYLKGALEAWRIDRADKNNEPFRCVYDRVVRLYWAQPDKSLSVDEFKIIVEAEGLHYPDNRRT